MTGMHAFAPAHGWCVHAPVKGVAVCRLFVGPEDSGPRVTDASCLGLCMLVRGVWFPLLLQGCNPARKGSRKMSQGRFATPTHGNESY